MNRTFQGFGEEITVRMPSMIELSHFFQNLSPSKVDKNIIAQKKLVKMCMLEPSFIDLVKKKPGCVSSICDAILNIYGSGDLNIMPLDQDELDDTVAAAWVEAEGKGFSASELFAFSVRVASEDEDLVFIFRMPSQREIEDMRRDLFSIAVDKAFVDKICVHGPLKLVEEKYIGLYTGLSLYAHDRAGNEEKLVLKK